MRNSRLFRLIDKTIFPRPYHLNVCTISKDQTEFCKKKSLK